MCMHTHHIRTHTKDDAHTWAYKHTYIHEIHLHTYTCTLTCKYTNTHECILHTPLCVRTHTHAHMHACGHTQCWCFVFVGCGFVGRHSSRPWRQRRSWQRSVVSKSWYEKLRFSSALFLDTALIFQTKQHKAICSPEGGILFIHSIYCLFVYLFV